MAMRLHVKSEGRIQLVKKFQSVQINIWGCLFIILFFHFNETILFYH